MNQRRRLIVKDSHKTTTGKVSVPVLPQFLQIFSKTIKSKYRQTEGTGPAPVSKCRDKSEMTVKPEKDIIAEFSISDFLFLVCQSLPSLTLQTGLNSLDTLLPVTGERS